MWSAEIKVCRTPKILLFHITHHTPALRTADHRIGKKWTTLQKNSAQINKHETRLDGHRSHRRSLMLLAGRGHRKETKDNYFVCGFFLLLLLLQFFHLVFSFFSCFGACACVREFLALTRLQTFFFCFVFGQWVVFCAEIGAVCWGHVHNISAQNKPKN